MAIDFASSFAAASLLPTTSSSALVPASFPPSSHEAMREIVVSSAIPPSSLPLIDLGASMSQQELPSSLDFSLDMLSSQTLDANQYGAFLQALAASSSSFSTSPSPLPVATAASSNGVSAEALDPQGQVLLPFLVVPKLYPEPFASQTQQVQTAPLSSSHPGTHAAIPAAAGLTSPLSAVSASSSPISAAGKSAARAAPRKRPANGGHAKKNEDNNHHRDEQENGTGRRVSNSPAFSTSDRESTSNGSDSSFRLRGGRPVLDAAAWEERRQRHNQVEGQRRQQLNKAYEQLQALVKSEDPSKSAVLRAAVEMIKSYESKLQQLDTVYQENRRKVEKHEKVAASVAPSPGVSNVQQIEHFKAFLHSGVAMHVSLINGKFVDCNEKFEELLKNRKERITNLSMFTITHPAYVPTCYNMVNNLIIGASEVEDGENKIVNCHGELLSVHVTSWVVRDENGVPKYVAATLVPIQAYFKPEVDKAFRSTFDVIAEVKTTPIPARALRVHPACRALQEDAEVDLNAALSKIPFAAATPFNKARIEEIQ